MSFSYDMTLSTTKDAVRLLLTDTSGTDYTFEDEEINGVLNTFWMGNNPFRAAAALLDAKMVDQVFLFKVIRAGTGEAAMQIDSSKMQQQMLLQASAWREQADLYDIQMTGGIDYAEQWETVFNWRERFLFQSLRLNPA